MTKKIKYTAFVISREIIWVKSNGDFLNEQPTSEEKLLGSFNGKSKFLLIELYKKIDVIEANTLHELNEKAWQVSQTAGIGYNFELFLLKK